MKALHYTIAILTLAGLSSLLAAQSGVTETTVGSQYIWAGAGSVSTIVTFDTTNSAYSTNYSTNTNVTVVAPEFQPSAIGSFVISSVSTNATNAIFSLVGNPAVDSYGVPLVTNEFKYDETHRKMLIFKTIMIIISNFFFHFALERYRNYHSETDLFYFNNRYFCFF